MRLARDLAISVGLLYLFEQLGVGIAWLLWRRSVGRGVKPAG